MSRGKSHEAFFITVLFIAFGLNDIQKGSNCLVTTKEVKLLSLKSGVLHAQKGSHQSGQVSRNLFLWHLTVNPKNFQKIPLTLLKGFQFFFAHLETKSWHDNLLVRFS